MMPSSRLARALTAAGIPFETSVLLRDCTTFRIGGPAALLCRPHTQEQLVRTLDIWRTNDGNCPLFILGRGSNVLFPDNGFPGLVICTRDRFHAREGTPCLRAGCGAALAALSRRCVAEAPALSGLEFACGIPGTLGGAVVMNAGAHQSEMANVVRESVCIGRTDGSPSDTVTVRTAMERNLASRRKNQPLEYPSAGSVFRRPAQPDVYVGRLVEDCRLKGFRIGGAEVSEKHAGFIVNRGDATADDVRRLIAHVQEAVLRAYGIELKCEVCIVREDGRTEREE